MCSTCRFKPPDVETLVAQFDVYCLACTASAKVAAEIKAHTKECLSKWVSVLSVNCDRIAIGSRKDRENRDRIAKIANGSRKL